MPSKGELAMAMVDSGLFSLLGDILVNEKNQGVLVCRAVSFLISAVSLLLLYCCKLKRMASSIPSIIGEHWRIWMTERESMCRDMTANMLTLVMVCYYLIMISI